MSKTFKNIKIEDIGKLIENNDRPVNLRGLLVISNCEYDKAISALPGKYFMEVHLASKTGMNYSNVKNTSDWFRRERLGLTDYRITSNVTVHVEGFFATVEGALIQLLNRYTTLPLNLLICYMINFYKKTGIEFTINVPIDTSEEFVFEFKNEDKEKFEKGVKLLGKIFTNTTEKAATFTNVDFETGKLIELATARKIDITQSSYCYEIEYESSDNIVETSITVAKYFADLANSLNKIIVVKGFKSPTNFSTTFFLESYISNFRRLSDALIFYPLKWERVLPIELNHTLNTGSAEQVDVFTNLDDFLDYLYDNFNPSSTEEIYIFKLTNVRQHVRDTVEDVIKKLNKNGNKYYII